MVKTIGQGMVVRIMTIMSLERAKVKGPDMPHLLLPTHITIGINRITLTQRNTDPRQWHQVNQLYRNIKILTDSKTSTDHKNRMYNKSRLSRTVIATSMIREVDKATEDRLYLLRTSLWVMTAMDLILMGH
jgi:hypothetical protein